MTAAVRQLPKPDSGHTGTVSTTVRMHRASWNAMKPRIQCVLTPWMSDFMASGIGGLGRAEGWNVSGEGRVRPERDVCGQRS